MRSLSTLLASLPLFAVLACPTPVRADAPNVAVAANLNFAMPEIAAAFKRKTGRDVKLAFGASGNFSRQIRAAAPFELFLSADEVNVKVLVDAGRTVDAGRVYAIGRLALFAPNASPVRVDEALAGLADAVRGGAAQRVAIANPELAPYGVAARTALTRTGLWDLLHGRIVLGENVNQTAQFALAGGVDAAFIPQSIVVSPNFKDRGRAALLPETLHDPIVQRMVLVRGAGETARQLYEFVLGAEARAILERYGFRPPAQGE
jgi:molybdate transport system substrate-binding protein